MLLVKYTHMDTEHCTHTHTQENILQVLLIRPRREVILKAQPVLNSQGLHLGGKNKTRLILCINNTPEINTIVSHNEIAKQTDTEETA